MTQDKADQPRISAFLTLVRFYDVLRKFMTIEYRKHGSSSMRIMVMSTLYFNGGSMSPTELSKRISRTRHSITSMVDTLERRGLVQREPNSKDRRSINITLTLEGRQLFERMEPVGDEIRQRALACLSDDEIVMLMTLLERIREHLKAQIANSIDQRHPQRKEGVKKW